MTTLPYFLTTLSSLHIGTGHGLDDIDLPVSRHPITGHPDAPGSALKGVWRDHAKAIPGTDSSLLNGAFGQSHDTQADFASAVSFGDGQLVLLPVKSFHGTFAWAASPVSLRGLRRLFERAGLGKDLPSVPASLDGAAVAQGSVLIGVNQPRLALHEFDLTLANEPAAQTWAEWLAPRLFADHADRTAFCSRFALISDEAFDFLCETALPVSARNRIGPNGIVDNGALWYEENVPAEALFAGVLTAVDGLGEYRQHRAADFLRYLSAQPVHLQLGGKATTGRGFVRLSFPTANTNAGGAA